MVRKREQKMVNREKEEEYMENKKCDYNKKK